MNAITLSLVLPDEKQGASTQPVRGFKQDQNH